LIVENASFHSLIECNDGEYDLLELRDEMWVTNRWLAYELWVNVKI
jgi:hypothetical protein